MISVEYTFPGNQYIQREFNNNNNTRNIDKIFFENYTRLVVDGKNSFFYKYYFIPCFPAILRPAGDVFFLSLSSTNVFRNSYCSRFVDDIRLNSDDFGRKQTKQLIILVVRCYATDSGEGRRAAFHVEKTCARRRWSPEGFPCAAALAGIDKSH